MIQKILNMPAQYLILALAGFVATLSIIIPVVLKLAKKKDGNFRTLFLAYGILLAFLMLALASFIVIFNTNIKLFLEGLGKGALILVGIFVGIGLFEWFINWISKD